VSPHHHTRNTLETTKWCRTCGRYTQHAVSDGRLAHCLEHGRQGESQKQRRARLKREEAEKNPTFNFEGREPGEEG
jgi:ribosomal protein L44E